MSLFTDGRTWECASLHRQAWSKHRKATTDDYDNAVMHDRMRPPGLFAVPCRRGWRLLSSLSPRVPGGKNKFARLLAPQAAGMAMIGRPHTASIQILDREVCRRSRAPRRKAMAS